MELDKITILLLGVLLCWAYDIWVIYLVVSRGKEAARSHEFIMSGNYYLAVYGLSATILMAIIVPLQEGVLLFLKKALPLLLPIWLFFLICIYLSASSIFGEDNKSSSDSL